MKQARTWSKLDNAAKIFPPTSTRRDTKVFRFSCELYEQVEPELLQRALEQTLERFPLYRSILKKGLFWYYLESSTLRPVVRREDRPPCGPLYSADRKTLLFEVTHYGRRINLEVYHALSDGTGALHFLRTMVFDYLCLRHGIQGSEGAIDYDAAPDQRGRDSFSKYYTREPFPKMPKLQKAYHIRGERFSEYRIGVIEGRMSTAQVLALARAKGVTLSEYLAAAVICAIHEGMTAQEAQLPVNLTVPVNLRRYFQSQSARNFFSVINVGYNFSQGDSGFDPVLQAVRASFRDQLEPERLRDRMNRLGALERNYAAKLIPLLLKNPVLKVASRLAEREITAAFSNVGQINMPPEVADHIRLFDIICSTKRLQICLCSYGDNLMVSFTSPFISTAVQRTFFRFLARQGLEVEVAAALPGEQPGPTPPQQPPAGAVPVPPREEDAP